MNRRLSLILASWLLLLASSLQAADDLLTVIPGSALGFAAVRHLSGVDAKLLALAQQVGVPAPSPLAIAKMRFGMQEGVDEQGSAAVALFKAPGENAMPPVAPVILIPVTDYDKFIAQFQPEDAKATVIRTHFLGDLSPVSPAWAITRPSPADRSARFWRRISPAASRWASNSPSGRYGSMKRTSNWS